jgi:hypothetical protein
MTFQMPDFSNMFNTSGTGGAAGSSFGGGGSSFGGGGFSGPPKPVMGPEPPPPFAMPSFDLSGSAGYGHTSAITLDSSNFIQKMKHPVYTDKARICSDTAHKSTNGVHHNFQLPMIGDYSHNFCISSNYIFKGVNGGMISVDCITNYIESITLSVGNTNCNFSRIDGLGKVETLSTSDITAHPKHIIKLEFTDLPLLTKYVEGGYNYQISIKFTIPPPIRYELVYDIMLTGEKDFDEILRKEDFMIVYSVRQTNNTRKKASINFERDAYMPI